MRRSRLGVVVCAGLLTLLAGDAAVTQLPLGMRHGALTGSIVSRSDPAQHYAVYLPSTFDRRRPTPVLFIMDYRGRARVAAEVFIPAAERYGWILMSSNDSASDEPALTAVTALKVMWTDAHDLFTLDERRLYLAGLSGTARTATWVGANAPGTIAGVIGAAAGFAPGAPPSAETSFLYFGTVGDADYNYWEMRELDRRLEELDRPHRIEQFTGGHGWMPRDLAMAAVEWMELRAMQSGSRAVDRELVETWWMRDLRDAATLEEMSRPLAAARRLHAMSRDYAGLRLAADLDALRLRHAQLVNAPALRAQAEHEMQAAGAHTRRIAGAMQIIASAFPRDASAPVQPVEQTLVDLGVPELLAQASSRDRNAALDARRLLAELDVQTSFYLPVEAMRTGADRRAAFFLDLARTINPADPYAWYLRARIAARAGDQAGAIDSLSRAVRRGFRTLDALEHDPAFDPLRPRNDFKRLVDQVRAAWEYDRAP